MKTLKTAVVPALVIVSLACGYGSKTYPPVAGTVPAITQLSPTNGAAGAGFILTVNGSNFATAATINWNGTAQTTTYVTGGQLTTNIPATLVAAAGTAQVTVTNPATPGTGMYGSGGTLAETSNAMAFTIN